MLYQNPQQEARKAYNTPRKKFVQTTRCGDHNLETSYHSLVTSIERAVLFLAVFDNFLEPAWPPATLVTMVIQP